jgi:hypothetical protein
MRALKFGFLSGICFIFLLEAVNLSFYKHPFKTIFFILALQGLIYLSIQISKEA